MYYRLPTTVNSQWLITLHYIRYYYVSLLKKEVALRTERRLPVSAYLNSEKKISRKHKIMKNNGQNKYKIKRSRSQNCTMPRQGICHNFQTKVHVNFKLGKVWKTSINVKHSKAECQQLSHQFSYSSQSKCTITED